ncbi:MAG: helix-turn-helix transcriptional regulator [Nitrospira sp.]|nr:helix-turn-helix transcriptional regulator [Nitrospira sp.]MCB1851582.1 helix-turn-helix transcriptional regulator [Gammaproteobacteria bacterium]
MNHFLDKWENQSEENAMAVFEEDFILDVTEKLFEEMERQGKSKADLATRMNKSKAYITQILNGSRNMTLKTLADIAYALNMKPMFNLSKDGEGWQTIQIKVVPDMGNKFTISQQYNQWSNGDAISMDKYRTRIEHAA